MNTITNTIMKQHHLMRSRVLVLVVMCCSIQMLSAQQLWNPLAVDVTRALTRDIFQSNAVPYVQPLVTTINATSNARFYDHAYVPASVEKPYFKVSINGMFGQIADDMKTYTPGLDFGPREGVQDVLLRHGTISIGPNGFQYNINPTYADTLGLTSSLIKELFRDGLDSGFIVLPEAAATLFGNMPDKQVTLPNQDQMRTLLQNRPEYQLLNAEGQAALDSLLLTLALPPYLTLPPGVNISSLMAAVPQFEIGSLYGTEALVRFIPPVEIDKNVGKFAFWGFGLKHSLSQYFPERWFDLAAQVVYQGTNLTNTVGLTESKLEADATIWSGNIHASKELWDVVAVYTGLNYETIDVTSTYSYVLPQEIQIALGLLPQPPAPGQPSVPTPEQPGDTQTQVSVVNVQNTNVKWTIGATAHYANVRISVDYSVSAFNILSAAVSYSF